MESWQHFLGVRSSEVKPVWLFFLHTFLLGIGTVLIYVVANVILLDNTPERSLPLAYGLSALAMMVVGKGYAYFEHHLHLKTLAVRALLLAVVCTASMGALVLVGYTMAAAIALMVSYRIVYLLTNLEVWAVSAEVFNVRQGRRLFSSSSSGDMPAKALGAVLAIFVHAQADLLFLLLIAFVAYGAALYTQHLTFQSQVVAARPTPARHLPPVESPLVERLLGKSRFMLFMGLSLMAIAAVGTGVEYFFFIHVKQRLQEPSTILLHVGAVLALTYLLAMLGKLLLTRHGLEKLGVYRTLQLLPVTALASVLLLGILALADIGPAGYLVYFCGLYLGLEVLRRAAFDPVFLVLFQPFSPEQRLRGHTLVQSFYEPLGMGMAGLLLFALHDAPQLMPWVPFAWMSCLLLGTIWMLRRTYQLYLEEMKMVVTGQVAAAVPPAAHVLATSWRIHDLLRVGEPTSQAQESQPLPKEPESLGRLVLSDSALRSPDLQVRKTAISNHLALDRTYAPARASLLELATAEQVDQRLVALALVQFLEPPQQLELLHTCLHSGNLTLMKAASQAATQAPTPEVITLLLSLLEQKVVRKLAADGLVQMGATALPALQEALHHETDYAVLRRLATICARLATAQSRQVLITLAQQSHLTRRAAALHGLSHFTAHQAEAPLFQRLMQKEMQLAQQLLHGMLGANVELRNCLKYELMKVQQRLFSLLLQLYDRQPILDAQRNLARSSRERQANALEVLDNLIPRPLYQGLQALVDVGRLTKKVQTFDELLGPVTPEPIITTILQRGDDTFAPWTISVALRQWQPTPATITTLHTYLEAVHPLIRESAEDVLQLLPARYPAVHEYWASLYPTHSMGDISAIPAITGLARLLLLKHTPLFAQTTENVLSSIVPIMKEVTFREGQSIFGKGDLGTSLFIIYEGEVEILTGEQHLATFHEGDFFGELALLDAEPRSASAVARTDVVAFRLDQEDFYDVMEECNEVLQNILRVLCQRLRLQNDKLKTLSQPHPA